MIEMIEFIKIVCFYIIIMGFMVLFFNYCHEKAHQAIFERRKIKSKIKIGLTENYCESKKDTKETNMSNDIVDAIGYQLFPIFIIIVWLSFIIITYILYKINIF